MAPIELVFIGLYHFACVYIDHMYKSLWYETQACINCRFTLLEY